MRRVPANATAMPAKPPISANTTLSISACRIWRETGAPSAAWIDVWAFARGGTDEHRFATLIQAIARTSAEIHISKCKPEMYWSRSIRIPAPPGERWSVCLGTVSRSAFDVAGLSSHCRNSTCICVPICLGYTPGEMRPIRSSQYCCATSVRG